MPSDTAKKYDLCILDASERFQNDFFDKMPDDLDEESGPAWIDRKFEEWLQGRKVCRNCSDGESHDHQDCIFFDPETYFEFEGKSTTNKKRRK